MTLSTSVVALGPPLATPLGILSKDGRSSHFSSLLGNFSGNVPEAALWVDAGDFNCRTETH